MQVTENFIRYLHTERVYKKGRMYYVEGRVKGLRHDAGTDTWRAVVTGSRDYNVHIVVHTTFVSSYCDCPAYPASNKCKHTCAVLFAVSHAQVAAEDGAREPRPVADKRTGAPKYNPAANLMRFFNGIQTEAQGSPGGQGLLKVEFTLRTFMPGYYFRLKETFNIQMRIGEERLYVVKDIRDFLHAVTHNNALMFGKNFTFDPEFHHFSPADRAVIDKLLEIRRTEIFYENSADIRPARKKGKEMLLPANAADDLILKLQHVDCKFENEDLTYGRVKIGTGDLPFAFALDAAEDEDYVLKIVDHAGGFHYDTYGWYAADGVLHKLTDAQNRALQPFTEYLEEGTSPDIPISTDQIGTFISGTLPKLEKISEVKMAEQISENVADPDLDARIYVDGTDYSLAVHIEYHYGDVIINPFTGTTENYDAEDKILIRDGEREAHIMAILENSGLKVSHGRLHADHEDEIFEFLHETLPVLEGLAEIYTASAVKSMILPEAPKGTVEVDAPGGNFLEVSFNFEGIGQDEISAVLEAVREKKKYVRLPGGAFVSLDDESLAEVAGVHRSLADKSTVNGDGTMTLPLHHGMLVEDRMAGLEFNTPAFGDNFRRFIEALRHPEARPVALPAGLDADLRDYQETGFKWMKSLSRYGLGGILADDMGLGKTIQCITYILSEIDEGADAPFLIVAPASLVYNWRNEVSNFAPDLRVAIAAGARNERREVLEGDVPDVYITSYHTLRQDIEWYEARTFHTLILDEAQAIKNYRTKIAQAVRQITAPKRFALSGTPVENSMDELWAVFQAVMPGFLFDQKTFRSQEAGTIARLIKPFILRRLKEDVLTELPERIETVHYSEMNKDQKKLYLAYLNKIQAEAAESLATEGLHKGRLKILAGLTRLRQLCCHPSLFVDDYAGGSGKLDALLEIIENAQANGQRMLIFSQFPSMLKIIREQLDAAGRQSYYLDGQTPGGERVRLVEAFNEGGGDIFLISLKAGGTGLNLTGADTVVLYDLWWNPAIEEQAIGRAHRMGQKNVVQVIRMIAQGTIEEKINAMQQEKKEMIDSIIQPGEMQLSSMSEEDIREILSI
ncbi:DEAD/DEAH box helicase [Lacicoccus alkaliphilus]|uniref:Helicase conserved C-terminal domain-containing protein n=1 Tax=Lacicoccus alkaliphilus DSM 16010 TaxID=1123231 RepID=A0A1M7FZD7_9BACL|nr:DEAD/DEAH box helicase [Salinicoccus alkaliphilus]SHM09393.1 Helicase conserved C-terminal domain-containing protein [Salinicoccus alkaliphilus DSM 16010]